MKVKIAVLKETLTLPALGITGATTLGVGINKAEMEVKEGMLIVRTDKGTVLIPMDGVRYVLPE